MNKNRRPPLKFYEKQDILVPSASRRVVDDLRRHVWSLAEATLDQPLRQATDRIRRDQHDHRGEDLPTRYLS